LARRGSAFSGTDTVAPLRGLPASARPPELDREYTEPTQLHAVTARQLFYRGSSLAAKQDNLQAIGNRK
jgi:hypothetical protein